MAQKPSTFKGIKDVFYETRVLTGRGYTLKRFAVEVLDKAVDPVMLSYIEKGKRFPSEALVRKLAQVRGHDPQELLVLLWQDRILYAFARELRRVMKGGNGGEGEGIAEAELAFIVSRAIAALPDDGGWMTTASWQRELRRAARELGKKHRPDLLKTVIGILQRQGLIEQRGNKVRRVGRHYVPGSLEEKRSLAMQFCGIFTKGILDKVVRQGKGTYVRNHYLQIPEEKIAEFHNRLDQVVRRTVEEFATEEGGAGKFLNVLITSTPF
jgi:hypothetical protein